jgi:pyroglutamyl-peptidase
MNNPGQQPTTVHSSYRFGYRSLLCVSLAAIIAIVYLAVKLPSRDATGGKEERPAQLQTAVVNRPVILLTGFEPFGKSKPANPSWEGIKALNGQVWRGYQLVCKEVPVVWGMPLQYLDELITMHEPVAIFSFGQGGRGGYTVESKAANERGKARDNRGDPRPTPSIVKDGPDYFEATIACDKIANILSEKGHPTRVSKVAGRYLCEECLYSLEYLKYSRQLNATVMFCHVPPLESRIVRDPATRPVFAASVLGLLGSSMQHTPLLAVPGLVAGSTQKVTPEMVNQFVKDTLEAWSVVYEGENAAKDARYKEVKELVERYFRVWSAQDMKAYDACFLPDAVIQFIDGDGRLSTMPRKQFIATQRDYHLTAPHKTTEVPESIDIHFEAKLARAVVYWKLTAGPRMERGYDHFTLVRQAEGWRIVNLVFYPSAKKITD